MASKAEDRAQLSEAEHQALDTLEAVPLAEVWRASRAGAAESQADIAAALREAGEDLEAIEAAIADARPLFNRLIAIMAEPLLSAAEALAATEHRGSLDPAELAQIRQLLNESPELTPALAGAVESVAIVLGLDRRALAWALLVELGEQASAHAPERLQACSIAIGERLAAAWPASRESGEPARALRVFRSAAVAVAGPDVRARALAADHPEQLALARSLVEAEAEHDDVELLIDRFDAARAALAAAQPARADKPELLIDGPKRKFTYVHVILAAIIFGLTVWHYVFR